ncbi:MAG: hypothetical protein JXR96_28055 [Deltaproteobacteria bacterium]|nr:hypothetical protein [Deltaproteobacteria bacterium]
MSLSRDFVEFIECLNRSGVEYLLVGGHALAFHGWPRFTKDIDFWVRATPENARKILDALAGFGFSDLDLKAEDFTSPGRVVQLGVPPNRIDIVNEIDGVEFSQAWARRVESDYAGARLLVIHRDDLVANKRSTGRQQDLLDLQKLTAQHQSTPSTRNKKP